MLIATPILCATGMFILSVFSRYISGDDIFVAFLVGILLSPLVFTPQILHLGKKHILIPLKTRSAIRKIRELESLHKMGLYSDEEYQTKLADLKQQVTL